MVFLFAVSAIHIIALVLSLRTFNRLQTRTIGAGEGLLTVAGLMGSSMLIGLPVLMEFASIAAFNAGKPVAWAGADRALWLIGVGAAVGLAMSGFRLYRQRQQEAVGFLSVGGNVLGAMLAGYFLFVVADQVVFYQSASQDAGMVNWSLVGEDKAIKDVQCDNSLIVVKGMHEDEATYRCPRPLTLVLGRFSGTPIVPWPSYTEGTTRDLPVYLKKLFKESQP